MLPIQPPIIPAYFSFHKQQKPPFFQTLFLSWEDALWHLVAVNNISPQSVVLVPDFFCWDVVENMQSHQLQVRTYSIDSQLQPDFENFTEALRRYQSAIVVIFHAVGITNPLMQMYSDWSSDLPPHSLIIEDCVHRVIDPQTIQLVSDRHFMIDSLRKVVPIQGSMVYSRQAVPPVLVRQAVATLWYRIRVTWWWLAMQFWLVVSYYTNSHYLYQFSSKQAEFFLQKGYDLIGDHPQSSPGMLVMKWLWQHLNLQVIFQTKQCQVDLYQQLLGDVFNTNPAYFRIPFLTQDARQLRGFPLGISKEAIDVFQSYTREVGLMLRTELNDSPWSAKQKIVYLPLGPHVHDQDIRWVCGVVAGFMK